MICQNCSSTSSDSQAFCGSCGHRLTRGDSGLSLSERLSNIEQQLAASQNRVSQQTLLAGNSPKRIGSCPNLDYAYVVLPHTSGILAVALAVIFGKGDFDLHSIAANAQTSVNGVLKQRPRMKPRTRIKLRARRLAGCPRRRGCVWEF